MTCLFYFLSISNALHVDYQMFFYYFCGNFVLTFMFVNVLFLFVDRPLVSLLHLAEDMHSAQSANVEDFKLGIVLGQSDVALSRDKSLFNITAANVTVSNNDLKRKLFAED